jgi:putative FmdB family regulatory protein
MPAYDFKCTACSKVFEVTRPSSDDSPVACPECSSPTKRVFSAVGVHFKGSGFYKTDSRKQPKDETPAPAPAACPSAAPGGACEGCPAAKPE